jgi:hypothetical protein
MLSFSSFMREAVIYKKPDTQRLADEEHGETVTQSAAIKSGNMEVTHPKIANAIHRFAQNKNAFRQAMARSSVQRIKAGTNVNNSEIGQGIKSVESRTKIQRVKNQLGSNSGIDRPIVLRHTDENGETHHHLLAGNTRATAVGFGVQAHHIDV